jgi:hypothetical protein
VREFEAIADRRSGAISVNLPTDFVFGLRQKTKCARSPGHLRDSAQFRPRVREPSGTPARGRRSVDNFNRHAEHVPRAALGKDVARVRRIGLELVSQPHDLCIDRTVVDVVVVQTGHVEELVARKDAMRRPEENNE